MTSTSNINNLGLKVKFETVDSKCLPQLTPHIAIVDPRCGISYIGTMIRNRLMQQYPKCITSKDALFLISSNGHSITGNVTIGDLYNLEKNSTVPDIGSEESQMHLIIKYKKEAAFG